MSSPRPTASALRALAGDGGYERGVDYARRGRVAVARWEPATQTLTAEVFGSERAPYRCRIRFDGLRLMSSSCSCPVATACKHVIAAVIVGPAESVEIVTPARTQPAVAPPPPREPWEQFGAFARPVPPPAWRALLNPPGHLPTPSRSRSVSSCACVRIDPSIAGVRPRCRPRRRAISRETTVSCCWSCAR